MTKDLKKLQKHWYKKLKRSGFKDIEYADGSIASCLQVHTQKKTAIERETTEAYYSMASTFLYEYQFETELDRIIWEYHAEGISLRNTVKLLNKVKIKTSKDAVWRKLQVLKLAMKARYLR